MHIQMQVDDCRQRALHPPMKKITGRWFVFVLALGLGFAAVSCSPKSDSGATNSAGTAARTNHPIVGKWAQGTNMVVTFSADGKMVSVDDGETETGEYWITNGNVLCVNIKGETETVRAAITFPSAKELLLTIEMPKNTPKDFPAPEPQKLTRVSE